MFERLPLSPARPWRYGAAAAERVSHRYPASIVAGRSRRRQRQPLEHSVIAYQPEFYPLLVEQVTEARVAELFAIAVRGLVRRYLLPKLGALNFVIDDVLDAA